MNEIDQLREENTVLRREIYRICEKCDNARSERDEAIRERDEARRQVCEFEMVNIKCAHDYATYRGWDCYKEKTT